jgi:hypothetical protein
MATKRQRYDDDDEDDSPVRGSTAKEHKRRLSHASARQKITAATTVVARFDVMKRLDSIVASMSALATDIGRHKSEPDMDYYGRVKAKLGLIPTWSMDGTDFDAPHLYRGCKGLIYDYGDLAVYRIPGDRWIDIYIGASACVLLSEGRVAFRYIEGLERRGGLLDIGIGT